MITHALQPTGFDPALAEFPGVHSSHGSLLLEIQKSLEAGLLEISPSDGVHSAVSDGIDVVLRRFSQSESDLLLKCARVYSLGRLDASKGRGVEACRKFAMVRQICAGDRFTPACRSMCLGGLLTAESYLDYQCGDHEGAGEKLLESIRCYRDLAATGSDSFITGSVLGSILNLVRVEAIRGRLEFALQLADQSLQFLSGRSQALPLWDGAPLPSLGEASVRKLARSLILEIGIATAATPAKQWDVSRKLFSSPAFIAAAAHWVPMEWLTLKGAYFARDTEDFLKQVVPFLSRGPHESFAKTWYLAAVDAAAAAGDLPGGDKVRDTVLKLIVEKRVFPRWETPRIVQRVRQHGAKEIRP